ncbi:phosphate ABC transporter permease PstA [Nitratireductor basaltis]|uniref:Phosphate transport system permease protein PstA n=1 Tax=Nitratireductor basaltis TaxID=472175 RepID=A0A084U7D1_9HYPH|nr:phosphate ABC transporter permease PstA [Nitratireductor basaltis]KFB08867.1 Phosphate ABC transporter inner membrane subunit PstA [Nitratireductor basaltis]
MTDTTPTEAGSTSLHTNDAAKARLKARYAAERRFKWMGAGAVALSGLFLVILLSTIVTQALPAFRMNYVTLPLDLSAEQVDMENLSATNFSGIVNDAIMGQFPSVEGRQEQRALRGLVSTGAPTLLRKALESGEVEAGDTRQVALPLDDFSDLYLKGLVAKDGGREALAAAPQIVATDGAAEITFSDRSVVELAREAGAIEEDGVLRLTSGASSLLLQADGRIVKLLEVQAADGGATATGNVLLSDAPQVSDEAAIRIVETPESQRKFTDREIVWVDSLTAQGLTESRWNEIFLFSGASREPEMAGIWGAVVGSALTMLVTLALAFPIGVAAAIYLEEFAPKNRLTAIIEVNINNLAAVPSIVFGLLGLAVFINWFSFPRSAPLAGGFVLALMTLPTIIIASRAALRAVPPSIREAALGIGASKVQTVFHHVLPLAMPGILTGTIIGMAQALGETAPLLMIGMVAFIVDVPGGFTSPATVLPVQIFMWADFPEPAFQQKTSAAILILLGFLVLMNAIAVVLRKRFERRW